MKKIIIIATALLFNICAFSQWTQDSNATTGYFYKLRAYNLSTSGSRLLFADNSGYITTSILGLGRLMFGGTGGILSQSANLFYDSTNNRLIIGAGYTPTNAFTLYNSANSSVLFEARNTNAGSAANVGLQLTTDGGTGYVYRTSSVYQSGTYKNYLFIHDINDGSIALTTGLGTTVTSAAIKLLVHKLTGNIIIGDTTDVASSKLTVASITQGMLTPRMTTTQKNAISSPEEGLIVYDLTLHKLYVWDGTIW